jgi:glycosyltransferase involved in cell wall biosynthesis
VTHPAGDDTAIDASAAEAFFGEYGDQARQLPPVAVVIAAYNEEREGAIGQVIETLPRTLCGLATTVIVVSDGSTDKTATAARERGALVCEVPVNRGQGAALRLGYRLAREGGASYIVTTDADGQYNPAEMERVLAPVVAGEADFCTGSRTLGSEESRALLRRLGVRVFARTISLLTGQRISDTTFGLRAMRAEVTGAVRLEQPQYQAAELLIGVMTRGFRVAEVPATIHRRRVGKSKKGNDVLYGFNFSKVVLGTWWRERHRAHAQDGGTSRLAVRAGDTPRRQPAASEPTGATEPTGAGEPGGSGGLLTVPAAHGTGSSGS